MSDAPLVSCLVLTHQFEEFVERSIASCLAQEYPADRLEVVVMDDGSTDRTPEIVAGFGDRVRYVRKPNGGLISSVNRGFSEVTGDFITLVSGDDEVRPERVRRQLDAFGGRPEVGLSYCDLEVIDPDGNLLHPSFLEMSGLPGLSGSVLGEFLLRNYVSGGATMVRRELVPRFHPLPEELPWEDWWLSLKVAEVAEVAFVDAPLYRYRLHGNNRSLGAQGDKQVALAQDEARFRRWVLQGNVDVTGVEPHYLKMTSAMMENFVVRCAEHTRRFLGEVLPVDAADRTASAEALAGGDAWRAYGHDPFSAAARHAVGLTGEARAPLAVRREVTVALVDEVAADPALLDRYERGPNDDATLVLYAPGRTPAQAIDLLGPAVATLSTDRAPDALIHAVADDCLAAERALLERADAILTAQARPGLD